MRFMGVDFSGDHLMWRERCRRSNVWVAEMVADGARLRLDALRRTQELAGPGTPFERLSSRLGEGRFAAAAIDAPFSTPSARLPRGGHAALLELVTRIPRPADRPFPAGRDLAEALLGERGVGRKEYRRTERVWIAAGINTRSTTWAGPRGGAPMTAACLSLLSASARPLWPWRRHGPGILAEAFPAAQLLHWNLPHDRYNGSAAPAVDRRRSIVARLRTVVSIGALDEEKLIGSADALDAVICAFAAVAVARDTLAVDPENVESDEGWIAVHR